MLHVLEFIKQHDDWRELLVQPPYCITIKDDGAYTILNYSQIDSNFNEEIVRECRGLIIRSDTLQPVCVPFFKFGNYGESYCPAIDGESARVQEKCDGSLIKFWYDDGNWHGSTSGMVNMYCAKVDETDLTFGMLFDRTASKLFGENYKTLSDMWDKNCTYLFELCCPENRVVVPHTESKIYHIGTRNNRTLEELNVDIGIAKPKEYRFHSIEDCIEAAKKMPFSEEGYVVVDKHWNRIKIKSPAYVAAFHLKNNGVITTVRLIDLLRTGESVEFLTYYPEYADDVGRVEQQVNVLEQTLQNRIAVLSAQHFETQKDFALTVKDDRFSAYYFEWRKQSTMPREWIDRMPSWRLAGYIEQENES
jgi:hypothetical protein